MPTMRIQTIERGLHLLLIDILKTRVSQLKYANMKVLHVDLLKMERELREEARLISEQIEEKKRLLYCVNSLMKYRDKGDNKCHMTKTKTTQPQPT
jgi:hypothetical protein